VNASGPHHYPTRGSTVTITDCIDCGEPGQLVPNPAIVNVLGPEDWDTEWPPRAVLCPTCRQAREADAEIVASPWLDPLLTGSTT
jgi:hypothetical protein